MAENTIEIEVELVGQDKALEGLDEIKDGAEGIGETFRGVGDIVGKTNEQLGESLNAVSEAVGSGVEAFQGMRDAMSEVAAGTAGIGALVGPISLLTVAIGGAYEAYRQFSGEAKRAEDRQRALGAASADLMQKLEQLAERGLVPARRELLAFSRANLTAQIQKELLENQIERASKVILREREAQEALTKAGQEATKVFKDQTSTFQEQRIATDKVKEAHSTLVIAQQSTAKVFDTLGQSMAKTQEMLDSVEKRYKKLEDQTEDGLKTQAKENIARLASVEALKAEVEATDEAAKLKALHHVERRKAIATDALEKLNREQLKALVNAQEVSLKALNEEGLRDKKLAQDIIELNSKKTETRAKETKAIDAQKLAQQALREEQMRLVKESQIRQLDIRLTEEGYAQQIALAEERYDLGLALAKDDALQRQIVERQHDLALMNIEDQRLEREEREDEIRYERVRKRIDAENRLLEKQNNKRKKIAAQELKMYQDFFAQYGKGLAQSAAASILFGDSFQDAAAAILKSLSIEAGARSLMELAAGTGALALGSPTAAAHFKAAAIFGAAAGAARVGSGVLGAGGGGGATGGTTASPTGAPQVATTPQREQADERSMIFNLNFGGAVIYDTKEAAKRAMIGDIVRTYNGNNRGMPRFNLAR